MSKYLADQIYINGWFQAFLDNEDRIPKNIKNDWEEIQRIADEIIQPKVDKLLVKYLDPSIFE